MNAFVEHHKNSLQFGYRGLDRMRLNGWRQPFQPRERGLGFFNSDRQGKRVTRRCLTESADPFQYGLKNRTEKWGVPLLDAAAGDDDESRRNKFVEQYFQDAKPHQVVALLQAREPARILVAMGDKDNHSPHLEYQQRWIPSSRMRIASQWCWLRQSRAENEK